MDTNEDNYYENSLKQILTPSETHGNRDSIQAQKKHTSNKKQNSIDTSIHKRNRKVPPWLEILIRLFAGIITVGLLIFFAIQIAAR